MSQEYEPAKSEFVSSYFEQFLEKEFDESDISEMFHENTKYTEQDLELGESAALFTTDPSMEYAQAKLKPDYRGKEKIELPEPGELDVRFDELIMNRRSKRNQVGEGISLQELSTLLQYSCGVTGRRSIESDDSDPFSEVEKPFRAYASGGALYPSEIYFAVVNGGENLDPGLYYYVPEDHALRVLHNPDDDEAFADAVDNVFASGGGVFDPKSCAFTFFITGSFWRSKAKYGPRGYRFILQETGHLGQNVLLTAEAMDLAAVPLASFYDDRVNNLLGIDGVNEAVTYTIPVGRTHTHSGDTHE